MVIPISYELGRSGFFFSFFFWANEGKQAQKLLHNHEFILKESEERQARKDTFRTKEQS